MSALTKAKPDAASTLAGKQPADDRLARDGSHLAQELLGLPAAGDPHAEDAAPRRKALPDSVAMLILVVAVAGIALFLMRELGLGSRLQFANVKIDYPIDADPRAGIESARSMLADLKAQADIVQVPLHEVQKNPFELEAQHAVADIPYEPGLSDAEVAALRAAEARKQQIAKSFAALDLNSVLLGSTPVARISGQTVRVGDMLQSLFLVKAIHARTVELEADGVSYTLSLGE